MLSQPVVGNAASRRNADAMARWREERREEENPSFFTFALSFALSRLRVRILFLGFKTYGSAVGFPS
jgi:hypothetical protein